MDIKKNWNSIRHHFNTSFRSNFHVSVASVDTENKPTNTPIGSLFLNDDQTGFYFEIYPSKLPLHAKTNPHVCVLGVNSNSLFWFRSLFKGKFKSYPAIKLYGELGTRRKASEKEIHRMKRRFKSTNRLKGNQLLWGNLEFVREINFTKAEMIHLGKMTSEL